ncbi:type VI secretion protein ImpA [Rhodoferax koreense]|uniref:Type VI secretion protein ImpA n=1 Tax=Rhodoferax koreensis TaxID=1842727 RepID=A0A1P8JYC3_9BURK|nr:type VI secretion system Vgr family protein [Rhodoferax koreense]APW38760.1 type VI secretion protein ImpA [Rhodoferax koreense]
MKPSSHTLTVASPAIPLLMGEPALQAVRLAGNEGINTLFEYELILKTPDALNLGASGGADWDLNGFVGREISCSIELDGAGQFLAGAVGADTSHRGAGHRQINAIITKASLWGEEGRHVQYRLVLRPWLHLATLDTDCRIFQNKTVVELLDELLADYPFPVEKRLIETYAPRDFQTQFNETNYAFFLRLTQENGINFFFAHSEGKHRLVLIDNMGAFQHSASEAYRSVDYHPPGWKTDAEYISSFVPHSELTSGRYTTRDYDYTRPRADLSASRSEPRPTGQAGGEVYQWHASLGGSHYAQPCAGAARAGSSGDAQANDPQEEGRNFAVMRMQALRTHGARARASGNLRGMAPGCFFGLQGHPRQKANVEYLILDTSFLIEDVAQDSQIKDAARGRHQQWTVQVDFTAHPMSEMLRPALTQPKPFSHGPQVALVVGPPGQNLWTDALGRIKIQFPWDRVGERNQNSSCWVRVTSPWAGNQLGAMQLPRIGQEVVVDFIGGDPDLPVCTGRVYNQHNLPPWALPGQSALSGFRSRELAPEGGNSSAGRSNHLVLDDTAQKIQAQLKSDHRNSGLSLGHITRIDDNAGRKEARGEGFELGTEGHGAVRAQAGLLISTERHAGAQNHIKEIDATVQRLREARELLEQITAAAQRHEAQAGGADQNEVLGAVKAQNQNIAGDGTAQGEFTAPHLVLASPAGITSSTPQSTHIASGQHTQLSSGEHLSIAAGGGWFASVVDKFALFVQRAGMKLVAAAGKISIQAQSDGIELVAHKVLALMSQTDYIDLKGKKGIRLYGGTSMLEISDQTQFFTASPVLFNGSLETLAPKTISQHFNTMRTSNFDQQVRFLDADGQPASKVAFDLLRDDGNIVDGKTGTDGKTPLQKSPDLVRYTVRYRGELP